MFDLVTNSCINVLVACEESQAVCKAFLKQGFNAYSCDIQPCSGGRPDRHIEADVLTVLKDNDISFVTSDGAYHHIDKWSLIIAHPPCTFLSNAGACRLYPKKGQLNIERYEKGLKAVKFFNVFLGLNVQHIAIENPIPSKIYQLPKYDQIIQPFEYGHPYSKKTCLWLKNLPLLKPTNILTEYKPYVSCGTSKNKGNKDKSGFSRAGGSSKIRSKTFEGIAEAMALQWGRWII